MDTAIVVERFIIDEIMLGDNKTKIDPNQSLIDSGILDSLALIRLMSFIEDRFEITIEEDEVIPDNFQSLNVIKSFLKQKL